MCGIAGVVRLTDQAAPPEREALLRMAGALAHRGPDEFGIYRDHHAGLAHARLSIIDLSAGQQPLANEDGTLFISFNGEIYNYIELREELIQCGHHFRTKSDTEVIVHAFEQWGNDVFERMSGQWAVALWDTRSRTLVLSRDRFGVRPLHVAVHAGRLYFASEVKGIFAADPTIPRELDPIGLDQTFSLWSVVAPRTVFRGIEELRPGSIRIYARGACREREYWRPSFPRTDDLGGRFAGSFSDAVHAVRDAVERATSLRMLRADVPVGSYLSGGLDSSLVAALGRKFARDRFKTFSLRFADAEYDEHVFQRTMVEWLGSDHAEIAVSRADIARVFPEVIRHTERPVLRTAPAPLYLLSRLVRDSGIKVVLTGEGADEVFAGYDLFREGKIRRFWARQPGSAARPRLLERLYPYLARSPVAAQAMARQFFGQELERARVPGFAHGPRWNGTRALRRLFSEEVRRSLAERDTINELLSALPSDLGRIDPLAQDQVIEMHTLLSGYLLSSQGDRMLTAHSVEGRFPFLDKDVVALAASLPPEYKLFGLKEKHVLKSAAKGLVPARSLRVRSSPIVRRTPSRS
jgi:asparagine synthase (glutamine-hydrolysing)